MVSPRLDRNRIRRRVFRRALGDSTLPALTTDHQPAIVFVTLTGHMGGPTQSLLPVLGRLPRGVRSVLVSPSEGAFVGAVREQALAAGIVNIPRPLRLRRLSRLASATRIVATVGHQRRQVAVVHANGTAELNIVMPAAVLFGKPVVVWAHGSEVDPWTRRLVRLWLRTGVTVRWAAVSAIARESLVACGVPREQITVIPNPIDPQLVLVDRIANSRAVTVGFLGTPLPNKGLQLVPDVVDALSHRSVHWLIFCERWARRFPETDVAFDRLEALDDTLVAIVGRAADVREAFRQCDIVFCPSFQESFCRVAAEAMLNGIPVVASDIPAFRELVGDDEAGLLFPVGDAPQAAAAIDRLANDSELRRTMGSSGRRRARQFDPALSVGRLLELYGLNSGGR